MEKNFSFNLSDEELRQEWRKMNKEGRINGVGRDNSGNPIDYSKTSNEEKIADNVAHIIRRSNINI